MCLAQGFRVKISVHDVYVSEKINSGYQMILGAFLFRFAIWSKRVDAVSKQSPREDGKHAGHLHRALGQGLWRCGRAVADSFCPCTPKPPPLFIMLHRTLLYSRLFNLLQHAIQYGST
jgi:hypothetical protein